MTVQQKVVKAKSWRILCTSDLTSACISFTFKVTSDGKYVIVSLTLNFHNFFLSSHGLKRSSQLFRAWIYLCDVYKSFHYFWIIDGILKHTSGYTYGIILNKEYIALTLSMCNCYSDIVQKNDFHSSHALELVFSNLIIFHLVFQRGLQEYTNSYPFY